ncbi:MAG: TetR/AcrR family transcriptional regulator [Chthoniobacteraceae bacterium]
MRYESTHKEATHRHIVEVASERFRKEGIDSVGVASLMGDAGLTHGGFYSHFSSKEGLVEEALEEAMTATFEHLAEAAREGGIEGLVRYYLRPEHRDHPETGCVAATLTPEIARRAKPIRAAAAQTFARVVALIESLLPWPEPATAQAIFATLVGTLQLARTVPDPALSAAILDAGRAAALTLASGGLKSSSLT